MPDASDNGVLDEGLSRLAVTGPEFAGGLSNHGPMAAEALVRLGRADAVEHWLDEYIKRLDEAPRPADPVTDQTWREALGEYRRVADWEVYFRAQLAGEPWRDVVARWWPRLVPGIAAAATHGVIRTSHAARSLAAASPPGR
jgi:Questin oxidase-like